MISTPIYVSALLLCTVTNSLSLAHEDAHALSPPSPSPTPRSVNNEFAHQHAPPSESPQLAVQQYEKRLARRKGTVAKAAADLSRVCVQSHQ